MPIVAAIALVLISAILSVAFPLATYTFTLATFGLTHVLTELHYVNNRFRQRLDHNLCLQISQLLLIIICLRSSHLFGLMSSWVSIPLELICVVGLVALVIPVLIKRDWRLGILGSALCGILILGIFWSATLTLLLFTILHNITPVGFIAEKLRGKQRNYALLACVVVFILIPLVIISGVPNQFLSAIGWLNLNASLFSVGELDLHLGVFVPPQLHHQGISRTTYNYAIAAFSAAVFLQSMHYAVVIGILPKWENTHKTRLTKNLFPWIVLFLSTLLFLYFSKSFLNARSLYGIISAVHAWVEIPILLLALAIPEETKITSQSISSQQFIN
jgi:hypothetical protein